MRRTKYLIVLSIVLMYLMAIPPRRAFANDCFRINPKVMWEWSAAVFAGKVIRLERVERLLHSGWTVVNPTLKITFQVTSVWKGLTSPVLIVYTSTNYWDGGYDFQSGKDYLVYAYQEGHDLATDNCRTRLLAKASEDLQMLGAGQPPSASPQMVAVLPVAPPPQTVTCPTWLFVLIAGIAIVLRYLTRNAHNSLAGMEVDSPDYYR